MIIEVKKETRNIEVEVTTYACDECGDFLYKTEYGSEYDPGLSISSLCVELRPHSCDKKFRRYTMSQQTQLCTVCTGKKYDKVAEILTELGFTNKE